MQLDQPPPPLSRSALLIVHLPRCVQFCLSTSFMFRPRRSRALRQAPASVLAAFSSHLRSSASLGRGSLPQYATWILAPSSLSSHFNPSTYSNAPSQALNSTTDLKFLACQGSRRLLVSPLERPLYFPLHSLFVLVSHVTPRFQVRISNPPAYILLINAEALLPG